MNYTMEKVENATGSFVVWNRKSLLQEKTDELATTGSRRRSTLSESEELPPRAKYVNKILIYLNKDVRFVSTPLESPWWGHVKAHSQGQLLQHMLSGLGRVGSKAHDVALRVGQCFPTPDSQSRRRWTPCGTTTPLWTESVGVWGTPSPPLPTAHMASILSAGRPTAPSRCLRRGLTGLC